MIRPLTFFLFFYLFIISSPAISSSVSVTYSPKTLVESGDLVNIQWNGVETPTESDWLGIYSPPNSSNNSYIGYVFLSSCNKWRTGSCSIDLPLVNLRSKYEFRIFRWRDDDETGKKKVDPDHNPVPGTKHMLAKSEGELGLETGRGPEQIHLALTDHEDEMRVMFITEDGKENYVKYGGDENAMNKAVNTFVSRYEREDMCDAPANHSTGWRDPGFIRQKLEITQKVLLQGWSDTHSFMSRAKNSDETYAILFGDMGTATPYSTFHTTQDESVSTMKWILRDIEAQGDKPIFISHIGDIGYARGYSWVWDTFFTQIEPVASKVPYHVCIGNHEYNWPLQPWKPDWANMYGKDGGGESPATRNLFYSFDSGVVHFVYLSTETNFLPGGDQYNFIKHDLETVNRTKTPFVVVQGHRPMYTTSDEYRDVPLRSRMLEHYEPLFVKNKVTLAVWGHVHRYERFCPLKNFTCGEEDEALPVHIVIGMGGHDWQTLWTPRPSQTTYPIFPQPERSLFRTGEFGYTRLFATKEKLTLTFIGNHDGEPHDMVEILASSKILRRAEESSNKSEVENGYLSWFISHGRRVATSGGAPVKTNDV
ncbi:hypothetical protein MKW98_022645 [Papaver atlanticum]|uniref:Purple acid phosphatase n=1 Tax=Papaver atlanticum TaxID=357466 RepID=A0AAD4XN85_9MAGN|nr:hypothetical protein MKW98_022645 [Papaver atlanticum]